MNRADLRAALAHPNVAAFLRVIREGESRQDDSAYRLENGGRVFPVYQIEHPSKGMRSPPGRAFGAFQFLASTWSGLVRQYGFENMGPACQNEAAVALIDERRALDAVKAGDLDTAFRLLNTPHSMWTSLPGGSEQNAATGRARETFVKWGGNLAAGSSSEYHEIPIDFKAETPSNPVEKPEMSTTSPPPLFTPDPLATEHYGDRIDESTINPVPSADEQEAHNMDPLTALSLIATVGPQIVGLIPQVKKLFDPSVPVAERNVGAAVAVLQTISDVAKTPDVHAAVAQMKSDPQLRQDVTNAVLTHPEVIGLLEIGGGIAAARKANAEAAAVPLGRDRAFTFGMVFMAAVFMLLADFLFVHPDNYDGNLRTQIVTAILALAAVVGAYFFGTSQGSQRKTDILANQEK